MEAAVLVPIKAFRNAKGRLAPAVSPTARADLARMMAARVLAAARPFTPFVVCDDDEVEWPPQFDPQAVGGGDLLSTRKPKRIFLAQTTHRSGIHRHGRMKMGIPPK